MASTSLTSYPPSILIQRPYVPNNWSDIVQTAVPNRYDPTAVPFTPGPEGHPAAYSVHDYQQAWAALLPTGSAWPREPSSVPQQTILGLCGIWGEQSPATNYSSTINLDQQAALLLGQESDPRRTVAMLPDWEAAWGLPDLCLAEPLTIADRQKALVSRITTLGGQSRQWFLDYAAAIGYTIQVIEHSPYVCGISRCGDTSNFMGEGASWHRWELGPATMRFYWTVAPSVTRLSWFRCGSGGGQVGVDTMLTIAQATDLECAIRRYKPAHVQVSFDYAGLEPFNPFSGTGTPREAQYGTGASLSPH